MVAWVAVIVALVGLLAWALSTNGNVKTIGLALFTAGAAATLVLFGGEAVRVLPPHR